MENNIQQENRIRKEVVKSPIEVSRVYTSDFQKEGTVTAELKQVIKTTSFYPAAVVSNSLQDNIFTQKDFGFEEKPFENTETRVAWIDVPVGSSIETVSAKLAEFSGATLYRILSSRPIIADTEQNAINNPDMDVTLDVFANRQAVRYPENHAEAGKLALINGKVQYRKVAFSVTDKADMDLRSALLSDTYLSPELNSEVNGVVFVAETQQI
jgi:hypothetical protein